MATRKPPRTKAETRAPVMHVEPLAERETESRVELAGSDAVERSGVGDVVPSGDGVACAEAGMDAATACIDIQGGREGRAGNAVGLRVLRDAAGRYEAGTSGQNVVAGAGGNGLSWIRAAEMLRDAIQAEIPPDAYVERLKSAYANDKTFGDAARLIAERGYGNIPQRAELDVLHVHATGYSVQELAQATQLRGLRQQQALDAPDSTDVQEVVQEEG